MNLLPCPFCGGTPNLIVGKDVCVHCPLCGASSIRLKPLSIELRTGVLQRPVEFVTKHWNARSDKNSQS